MKEGVPSRAIFSSSDWYGLNASVTSVDFPAALILTFLAISTSLYDCP